MIDLTAPEGNRNGEVHLGIYELGKKTRKLCFAPPRKERHNVFSTKSGSQHIVVTFEREKAK